MEVLRLWVYRIFDTPHNLSKLFSFRGVRDDDILSFLGMPEFPSRGDYNQTESKKRFQTESKKYEAAYGQTRMPQVIRTNFDNLAKQIKADRHTARILEFLAVRQTEAILFDCMNVLNDMVMPEFVKMISRCLRMDEKIVQAALAPGGYLMQCGIVHVSDRNRLSNRLPVLFSQSMAEGLLIDEYEPEQLLREIVVTPPKPTLTYRDYPHLGSKMKLLRDYMRIAIRTRRKGVNILFYGKPGTGKSELSRVLAREMRCTILEVSSEDKSGDPIDSPQRLNCLRIATNLLGKSSILVFDEAEDIFSDGSFIQPSIAHTRKAWRNRMLENNKTPTIWILNSRSGMDPAIIRRFDFVFEIGIPPRKQREKSIRKICSGTISNETISRLSAAENLAPAVVARAAEVMNTLEGKLLAEERETALVEIIDDALRAQGSIAGLRKAASDPIPRYYDLDFLNCSRNLKSLKKGLRQNPSCRICLYGPPGTGKSLFAHWLSRELDKPLVLKRASDLLSPYLGETEQNLSSAFQQAIQQGAILLIDEVDSFLQERKKAQRSWEVTQVNEMLTQMESFPGTFIASTNLMDGLDSASLRRFDLKLHFDYLKPIQAKQLLLAHCRDLKIGKPGSSDIDAVQEMQYLTPGDFANVTRQQSFCQFTAAADLVEALREELSFKSVPQSGRLGFG